MPRGFDAPRRQHRFPPRASSEREKESKRAEKGARLGHSRLDDADRVAVLARLTRTKRSTNKPHQQLTSSSKQHQKPLRPHPHQPQHQHPTTLTTTSKQALSPRASRASNRRAFSYIFRRSLPLNNNAEWYLLALYGNNHGVFYSKNGEYVVKNILRNMFGPREGRSNRQWNAPSILALLKMPVGLHIFGKDGECNT